MLGVIVQHHLREHARRIAAGDVLYDILGDEPSIEPTPNDYGCVTALQTRGPGRVAAEDKDGTGKDEPGKDETGTDETAAEPGDKGKARAEDSAKDEDTDTAKATGKTSRDEEITETDSETESAPVQPSSKRMKMSVASLVESLV
jgi:hypothetical protein